MIPDDYVRDSNLVRDRKAWVLFSGKSELKSVRWLKTGFKHCFVVFRDGARWITCDPLSHKTEIMVHDFPESFDLVRWLEGQGLKSVEAPYIATVYKPSPLMFYTCVESVKRLLGIRQRTVFTPYQLHTYLNKIKTQN